MGTQLLSSINLFQNIIIIFLLSVFIYEVILVFLLVQNPVQGAIPTNLPNTAVGLRPPYSPNLQAPSSQLPPAFFSSSINDIPPLEPYSPLGQRDQGSTHAQDALGGFPTGATDVEGKAGVTAGGLDSLSEYTLPGKHRVKVSIRAPQLIKH